MIILYQVHRYYALSVFPLIVNYNMDLLLLYFLIATSIDIILPE